MSDFYKKSDLLLFTSKYEGYPMVLLESKAYALPIVMYNLDYLQLLEDRMGIMTSEIGNIKNLADDINKIFDNDTLRKKLSDGSRMSFLSLTKFNIQSA